MGGALEGALCGKRSIALSFGSKDPQPDAVIEAACVRAVKFVEWLCANWDPAVEVYNINVPMIEAVSNCPVVFTTPTRSYWSKGSLFVKESDTSSATEERGDSDLAGRKRSFRWHPDLSDINKAAMESPARRRSLGF